MQEDHKNQSNNSDNDKSDVEEEIVPKKEKKPKRIKIVTAANYKLKEIPESQKW